MNSATKRAIGDFARGVQRDSPIPGLGVAVAETADSVGTTAEDPATYADGFGARDLAGNRPVTGDTLFGVGSVTEPITAAAILQLSAAGLLDTSDPLADHLDVDLSVGGSEDDPTGEEWDPIRLHHLLTHTSGLPALGVGEALLARRLRIGADTLPLSDWEDVRAHVESGATDRLAPPGERVAHCPAGYVLLGRVVEECTGRAFAEYVAEHLLDPLGLDRATFDDTAFAMDDDHMTQYLIEDGTPTAASLPTADLTRSATGLLASPRHLAAILRLHLNHGHYAGTEVVAEDGLRTARENPVETATGTAGYGWRVRSICDWTVFERTGDIAVSGGYAGFAPEAGVGVAVATNTVPELSLRALGAGVFACIFDKSPFDAVPELARRQQFDRLAGEYRSHRGVRRACVGRDGELLRIEYETPLETGSRSLIPVETDENLECGPIYEFTHRDTDGDPRPVRFDTTAEPTTLDVDGWRLHHATGDDR
jgi:CubicO group peptidase (beta-lactamase class C family)